MGAASAGVGSLGRSRAVVIATTAEGSTRCCRSIVVAIAIAAASNCCCSDCCYEMGHYCEASSFCMVASLLCCLALVTIGNLVMAINHLCNR